jgi:membrane protein implicated in regulation of membrane protease activity
MRMPNRYLAPLPPVLCNALLVGATIAYAEVGLGAGFWTAYALNALSVGAGELVVCYGLGIPLLSVLDRVALPLKK